MFDSYRNSPQDHEQDAALLEGYDIQWQPSGRSPTAAEEDFVCA